MTMINVSLAEVSDTAAKLRTLGEQMYEEQNQMKYYQYQKQVMEAI